MTSQTTTLPTIGSDENGNGATNASTEILNSNGQAVFTRDSQGFITYQAWDSATGALIKSIQDLDTSDTSDYDPTLLPSGWTTPTGGGLNLVTTYEVDSQGRTVLQTDPNGDQTVTVYKDGLDTSTGFVNEQRVYPGWHYDATLGKYTTTGPVQVTRENRYGSYSETLTYAYTPVSGVTLPDGSDTIDSGNIQSLSSQIFSDAGQEVAEDDYVSLAGVTYSASTVRLGTAGTNYNETRGARKGTRSVQPDVTSGGLVAGGRPGGRSVRSNRKARAVSTTQVASPKGVPRCAERRRASSSASVSGRFTCSTQSRGSGTGHSDSTERSFSVPRSRRQRLDQRHCSARCTRLARDGLRST
jgi:hypothetical protein